MNTKLRIAILAQLTLVLPVGGVTMTLNPQLMVVGSTTEIPLTMLEMRCATDGTIDIQYLIQIKILRRKFTETSFTGIAVWKFKPGSLNGETQLESNLPQDILSRTPNASASIDPSQKSGVLTVIMNGQGLTCSQQAEFNCSLSYMDVGNTLIAASENKNFSVTATPNDVLMDSAEYYDNNGNTLQLTNNMQLNVGTRIIYKCTANIGSLATGEIIWDRSPELQGSNTPFIPYTPTITTDIVQEGPQLQPDGCSYRRISTMYYNLTNNDYDGITFRCRARSYLGSQWYEAVSNQQFRTVAVRTSGGSDGLDSVGGQEATPNDVRMDSAEYYDNNGNTLQLANNTQLNVGTRIKYKCTAKIGSLATGEIIWDRSPELQGSNTPFIPYTPTITTDIVQEGPQLQPDGCSYRRISTMYYNLTSNDYDGITFRCRARSYLGSQWYEAVSNQQFKTVAVHTSDGSAGPNSGGGQEELQSQLQSRSHTYDGLKETVVTSEPYAILNVDPTENNLQSNYLNPYDRLNRTVGSSEPYDMLESRKSDANVQQERNRTKCYEVGL